MDRHLTMPQIRQRMHRMAATLGESHPALAKELRDLAEQTKRRPAVRRAPTKNRPVTVQLAFQIREYAREHPDASCQEIGVEFDVNAGRVSEVLAGKRGAP